MTQLYLWYGVFGPGNELEAVEESPELAQDDAAMLSMGSNQERTVRLVTILTVPLDDYVMEVFEKAKQADPGWPHVRPSKSPKKQKGET